MHMIPPPILEEETSHRRPRHHGEGRVTTDAYHSREFSDIDQHEEDVDKLRDRTLHVRSFVSNDFLSESSWSGDDGDDDDSLSTSTSASTGTGGCDTDRERDSPSSQAPSRARDLSRSYTPIPPYDSLGPPVAFGRFTAASVESLVAEVKGVDVAGNTLLQGTVFSVPMAAHTREDSMAAHAARANARVEAQVAGTPLGADRQSRVVIESLSITDDAASPSDPVISSSSPAKTTSDESTTSSVESSKVASTKVVTDPAIVELQTVVERFLPNSSSCSPVPFPLAFPPIPRQRHPPRRRRIRSEAGRSAKRRREEDSDLGNVSTSCRRPSLPVVDHRESSRRRQRRSRRSECDDGGQRLPSGCENGHIDHHIALNSGTMKRSLHEAGGSDHIRGESSDEELDLAGMLEAGYTAARCEAQAAMSSDATEQLTASNAQADRFRRYPSAGAAVRYAMPHEVVSQILGPDLAVFMPNKRVLVRNHGDEVCCVDTATFTADDSPLHAADIEYLEQLPCLVCLGLRGKEVGTAQLALVTRLTRLQHLSFFDCDDLDASGFAEIAKLTQLTFIHFFECSGVTTRGLAEIAQLTQLQHLALHWCEGVDATGLAEIAKLTQLRRLDLTDCRSGTTGFVELAKLQQLQHLDLSDCDCVGARVLAGVSTLAQLKHLNLSKCRGVTAAGLAEVARISQLQHFTLFRCPGVNAAGLAQVAKLTKLQYLGLRWCAGVDTAGLAEVSKLKQLTHLNLSGCSGVDAAGLAAISKLPQLRQLDLRCCDNVDAAAFAKEAKFTVMYEMC